MKKILITEDDNAVAKIYRDKFENEGLEVVVVGDGKEAIREVKKNPPDAVLLDLMLPGVSGVKVIEFIRRQKATRDLPVIVLSNGNQSHMVQAACKAGANKCLTKATATPRLVFDEVCSVLTPPEKALPAPSPVSPSATASTGRDEFQLVLIRSMLDQMPQRLADLRRHVQAVTNTSNESRAAALLALYNAVRSLTSSAGVAGCVSIAQVSSGLEALANELRVDAKKVNASTLRTIGQAVDFLGILRLKYSASLHGETMASPLILVVDDETISRQTVATALEKAHFRAIKLEDSNIALKLMEENRFDLIFLDVDMPGLNGLELCKKLRATEFNATTPVVFVTGLKDFETQAQSVLSGAADLIAKPVLLVELALKASIYLLRGRFEQRDSNTLPAES
jgi:DNA-binding response OmpR family regulator